MDFFLPLPTAFAATLFISLLAFLYHLLQKTNTGKNRKAPQAPGALPLIGHLHLLGGSELPHKVLANMAEKYGQIFTIKLGVRQVLVVSDSKMAKECLITNDKAFANRPISIGEEVLSYNYASFVFSPYGPYWQQMRKIVMSELLSQRRLEMLGHIQVSEVRAFIRDVYEACMRNKGIDNASVNSVKIDMGPPVRKIILNIIIRMILGKGFSRGDEEGIRLQEVMERLFDLLGEFLVADALPYLRWLDLGGYEKAMRKTAKEIDDITQGWLDDHRKKGNSRKTIKGEQEVFMDVMISTLEASSKEDLQGYDIDTAIKATCQGILAAGTDATTVTIIWALSLLLNNPEVLTKAQNELDLHVGKERLVEESDIKNLTYLQAIIKETLRLYPVGPLSGPRDSAEDCIVGGYLIPKGTWLFVNAWKIQHDSNIWPNPFEFQPERFLTSHKEVDVRDHDFKFFPFGSGRRVCPGISFALQSLPFTLANLIHGFECSRPSIELIDMSERFGLANFKATPLEVIVSPRLPTNLY